MYTFDFSIFLHGAFDFTKKKIFPTVDNWKIHCRNTSNVVEINYRVRVVEEYNHE